MSVHQDSTASIVTERTHAPPATSAQGTMAMTTHLALLAPITRPRVSVMCLSVWIVMVGRTARPRGWTHPQGYALQGITVRWAWIRQHRIMSTIQALEVSVNKLLALHIGFTCMMFINIGQRHCNLLRTANFFIARSYQCIIT